MTLQITKLPKIEWRDCHHSDCNTDSTYQIENMFHGALIYSCEDHLVEAIDWELTLNCHGIKLECECMENKND